ncbi:hypothetical protein IMAU10142_01815 [Lactobacillus helveticus]|nr:hypothetical protein [Lactobacillus helveticus]NRN75521.1 hypothetical protein [Lactobacillus helveticus]NRN81724.1 hypothetical protein [Lactobacillus helveticus]NRN83776.1 hypothetical protein [Lactobacillus helveticus]NRN85676.1 hypothetical protein [Lactobacillus helveticus]
MVNRYKSVFDIIGPVMVGPSSSHTAGVVAIGRAGNKISLVAFLLKLQSTIMILSRKLIEDMAPTMPSLLVYWE